MNMNNISNARYKRDRVRDSGLNANTKICFKVRATALRPHLHTEVFPLCPYRTFHKGISTEKLQLNTGSTQLLSQTLSPLHKREDTKPNQRKCYNLVITKITNNSLSDLKGSQTIFS